MSSPNQKPILRRSVVPPIEVIYENGVFRPLQPIELELPEGAVGQVLIAPTSVERFQQQEIEDADAGAGASSPGERAYLLLMEIAALPHTLPDGQADIGVRHDEILYPSHGRMP